jgi:hypothetical protein
MILAIVGFACLAIVVITWMAIARERSMRLRRRFGPEYERSLQQAGSRRSAEAELENRARRVERIAIRELTPSEHDRFMERWRTVQIMFVESPAAAVVDAERLVQDVMRAHGYPIGNFDQRAADLSVDHAQVVENYRAARALRSANQRGEAGTEDREHDSLSRARRRAARRER